MSYREQQARSDSDSMWVYTADDFSEEALTRTTFGIKFKDADIANAFKQAYQAAFAAASSTASPVKAAGAGAGAGAGAASGGASASASADAGTRLSYVCHSASSCPALPGRLSGHELACLCFSA